MARSAHIRIGRFYCSKQLIMWVFSISQMPQALRMNFINTIILPASPITEYQTQLPSQSGLLPQTTDANLRQDALSVRKIIRVTPPMGNCLPLLVKTGR